MDNITVTGSDAGSVRAIAQINPTSVVLQDLEMIKSYLGNEREDLIIKRILNRDINLLKAYE